MALLDSPKDVKGFKKAVISIWAVVEGWFFTGLFYGWSSLVFVFKEEGIYGDLCDKDTVTNGSLADGTGGQQGHEECRAQDERLTLCFTLASFASGGFSSLLGFINFRTGTRITRLICFFSNTIGILCLAFVSEDVPWLMFPGMFLLAVFGIQFYVTNVQVSYLFKKYSSTYVGLLNGALDSSAVIFIFAKIAHQNGFPRRNVFFILAAIHIITIVSTFLFLPKGFVMLEEEPKEIVVSNENGYDIPEKKVVKQVEPEEEQSVKKCLKQPLYISFTLWMSLLHLRFLYFMGSLNTFLDNFLNHDQNLVSYYTDVCFYTLMTGLFTAIIFGVLYDRLRQFCMKNGKSLFYKNTAPAIIPMACASLLSTLASVLILIRSEPLLYVIFIAITMKRSFLYAMMSSFIRAVFPSQFFGILIGVTLTTASVFACLQYAFIRWTDSYDNGRFHADICLMFISLVTLGHPIFMWISASKAERHARYLEKQTEMHPKTHEDGTKDEEHEKDQTLGMRL